MTDLPYLALGDSYTIGEGVQPAERWTHQLARALRDEGIALRDPVTLATTGWTTDELAAALDVTAPASDYALVSLAIGVNNQYRGRDVDAYAREFDTLLQRAIGFAAGRAARVLVLSIPDWGVTRFGQASGRDGTQIARALDDFNAAARRCCETRDVAFVDITPISRDGGDAAALLAADGLHPSAAMYTRWMQAALPVARHALSEP